MTTPVLHTRDVVLREAARLFADRGYRGTTVADIGSACGISGPALYKHFPSKYALLQRLLVGSSADLDAGGRAVVSAADGARDALHRLVEFHLDFALGDPDVIRVQDRDLDTLHDEDRRRVRALQRRYVEQWVTVLVELDPGLGSETARVRAHAVFGLLNSTPHSARSRAAARHELRAMALAALLGG